MKANKKDESLCEGGNQKLKTHLQRKTGTTVNSVRTSSRIPEAKLSIQVGGGAPSPNKFRIEQ